MAERTLSALRAWVEAAPPGTLVPAAAIAQALAETAVQTSANTPAPVSWRERLWTCPPETRLGVAELCEAIGRPKSWVYRHTGPNSPGARIPHRQLEGELVFVAGELRQYLTEHETVVVPGRTGSLVVQRRHA
ncbi:MAG TPA: hypothetical protein VKQ05_12900 [Gemmatimonadales bacterium]|nr:hypothetical protein [Gemmatimonadales bacterium]